ncbi:T9SS type A sorting domain-containing protein [Pseudoflavitalea sp. G-6-1-2]|uniref:T9SS type A sorting domain-containing protein n=1 Tax=Pseudoflavitalea sp. G-6-1-2 TaxID=2728841 RepID=UPI001469CB0E|nr:T9SS type A sorting domain-containing protein [Pseudoflavitalea sp. G-6-1-2]NML22756.1 T9SS type A sorting domain-containing protein [Pseudoflavitalea sp. G-6-1-2]
MKIRYLSLALFLTGISLVARSQCVRLAGIMVDACGNGAVENTNEFIFFLNGSTPTNTNDLLITLPANGAITLGNTNDFSPNSGTAPIGGCLQVIDDGDVIPANAPFLIFMSNNVSTAYDLSSWCSQYGTVYLLYRNLASPFSATFLNQSPTPTQRSVSLSINGSPACDATYTYDVLVGTGSVDGNFYRFPEPTAGSSLSPGFVNNGCASPPFVLLPVTLTAFTATYQAPGAFLNWTTSTELNTSYYEIQKSRDGVNYTAIGTVNAVGTSSAVNRYSYTDAGPIDGRTYYRLRIVDADGSSEFSKIVSVKAGKAGIFLNNLYPNPVTDQLTVEWNSVAPNVKTQVSIRDAMGRLQQTTTVTSVTGFNQLFLNTSKLSAGQYFLSLDLDKDNLVQPFLKR